jgi:TatD DNase family protein
VTTVGVLPPDVRYVDAHCHIDLFADPTATMRSAREQAIAIVAMTNTPSVFRRMEQLACEFDNVFCALGLHPELVAERHRELPLFNELAAETAFIGEIGMDGAKGRAELPRQRRALDEMLAACRPGRKHILSVHSRRASADILEAIAPGFPGIVILHWFSGSLAQAQVAAERGWFFSVNLAMTRSQSGKTLISRLPRDRVLTESDGPILLSEGRRGGPADVVSVVEYLGAAWGVGREEAREQVLHNFERCLRASHASAP